MKMADLSRQTNINPHTIADSYSERPKAIFLDTIENICEALVCTVGELIEYHLDEKEEPPEPKQ